MALPVLVAARDTGRKTADFRRESRHHTLTCANPRD